MSGPICKGSCMASSYGPLKRDPLTTPYIPHQAQGPVLQDPLKKVRDHMQGPCNYHQTETTNPELPLQLSRVRETEDLGWV